MKRWLWRSVDVIVMAAASAAQIGLAVAVAVGAAGIGTVLLAHGLVVAALGAWAWSLHAAGRTSDIALLFVIGTAGLGPIGGPGTLLSLALLRVFKRQATPFQTWYASLFPSLEPTSTRTLYERIVLRDGGPGERSSVAPFADVMATGTIEHKQAVITLIADHFRPGFASALRGALHDAEPAIRVQAATAAARIENQFLERSLALESQRAAYPDRVDALLELARHHDDYANAGLLDAARVNDERRQALDLYEQCDRLHPDRPGIVKAIARLLVRLQRYDEAIERLAPLVARGTASAALVAWYVESLYRLQRFSELRAACRHLGAAPAGSTGLPDELRQALAWWARGGPSKVRST